MKDNQERRKTIPNTAWLHSKFEWRLVAFAIGISIYFAWRQEPAFSYIVFLLLCSFGLLKLTGAKPKLSEIVLMWVFWLAGFANAKLHTLNIAAPILPKYKQYYTVNGWVESSKRSGKLQHFFIRVQSINNLSFAKTPKRVRVRIKPRHFVPGDAVQINAVLNAPLEPVMAGGYDGARAAYYKQIGGVGFAVSKPEYIELSSIPITEHIARRLTRLRFSLSRHIQSRAPPRTAALQAALLTGDRSALPQDQEQFLRDAGLAHLLAISGLHMGLLAGSAYGLASLLFSMIGPLARRYDMRKWAAVIGGVIASVYLLLSGASVSTQRAFIMALIVFAAIILGRRAVSLRSVAVAASITLFLHPESLLSAGFQMSFAATAALVVVYRSWADKRQYTHERSLFTKMWSWLAGVSITSLVAGMATAGFAALHFHRIARFGFFANLGAMPIFTIIVMPAGFVAVLLMPFGLDVLPLRIMGFGLEGVLIVAEWVGQKEGAIAYIKDANNAVVALFGIGFVLMCLGPLKIHIIGITAMIGAFIVWGQIDVPDMRVSKDARISFWDERELDVLHVDRRRGDKFGRAKFIENAGLKSAKIQSYIDQRALCDKIACRFQLKDKQISIVHSPEGVMEACEDSQLVILTLRNAGPRARRHCSAVILDADDLTKNGARDIYIDSKSIRIRAANPKVRKNRPWANK